MWKNSVFHLSPLYTQIKIRIQKSSQMKLLIFRKASTPVTNKFLKRLLVSQSYTEKTSMSDKFYRISENAKFSNELLSREEDLAELIKLWDKYNRLLITINSASEEEK